MFGFGKKKENTEDEQKSTIDKIVMGAIIGTAIGSVIGLTFAPKKGKETRRMIQETYDKDFQEIKTLTKETASGFFTLIKKFFSTSKIVRNSKPLNGEREHRFLKKIPNEFEIPIEKSKNMKD